jgi:HK97 family phage major capsid protein
MNIRNVVALCAIAALACAFMLTPDASIAGHVATACLAVPAASIRPALILPKTMSASTALASLPRAVQFARPRADASDPKAMLGQLQAAFEEFKKVHSEEIAGMKKGFADVVTAEKLDKVNNAVGDLQTSFQKAIDDLNAKVAANAAGGSVIGDLPATSPEYIAAFKANMRHGTPNAALTKSTDGEGGYVAPVEWDRTIVNKLKQISMIRQNARVISISVAGFKKLFNDRAVGSGWVGETASRPATSTPTFGSLDFSPGELYANPAISQQLLDDAAIDLEDWLAAEVDTEFARQEGIAFLSGDGTNKPYGILTYVTGAANAARHPWGDIKTTVTGSAAALSGDGFIDLMYSLPSDFAANAKLYINRGSLGAARKLKDGQGNYLWQPSYIAGEPQTLNGAPIVEVPGMPAVAAGNIAALYGDMEATYLVIDRIGISVLRDPYTNKPFVHFYTVKRVGGGVYNPEPMKALKVAAS